MDCVSFTLEFEMSNVLCHQPSLQLLGCWHQPGPSVSATDRRQPPGPQVVSQVKRESDVAEETAVSHCNPLLMLEVKRESDVAEETAGSHCKPLLMSEVKRESDVTEGMPESWMVKEIAEGKCCNL